MSFHLFLDILGDLMVINIFSKISYNFKKSRCLFIIIHSFHFTVLDWVHGSVRESIRLKSVSNLFSTSFLRPFCGLAFVFSFFHLEDGHQYTSRLDHWPFYSCWLTFLRLAFFAYLNSKPGSWKCFFSVQLSVVRRPGVTSRLILRWARSSRVLLSHMLQIWNRATETADWKSQSEFHQPEPIGRGHLER